MKEILRAGSVDDIAQLIADCQFPAEALFLAEMLPRHVIVKPEERQDLLRFTRFDTRIPFTQYTSGRIFHQDFELRWEKNDDKTQVVYLGAERHLPELEECELELEKRPEPKYYYLFGERLAQKELEKIGKPALQGDFAEVRIPRLLRYPAPKGAQRVRLGVCEYVQETTGKVGLFRFQSLEAAE